MASREAAKEQNIRGYYTELNKHVLAEEFDKAVKSANKSEAREITFCATLTEFPVQFQFSASLPKRSKQQHAKWSPSFTCPSSMKL